MVLTEAAGLSQLRASEEKSLKSLMVHTMKPKPISFIGTCPPHGDPSMVLGEEMLVGGWGLRVQGLVVALRQGKECEGWWGQCWELGGTTKAPRGM